MLRIRNVTMPLDYTSQDLTRALARALRTAVSTDPDFGDQIPSTKGVL